MDEEDVSIRPSKRVIPIQTVEPNKIVKLSVDFDSRGKENKAISVWKMMDANNQDCFQAMNINANRCGKYTTLEAKWTTTQLKMVEHERNPRIPWRYATAFSNGSRKDARI